MACRAVNKSRRIIIVVILAGYNVFPAVSQNLVPNAGFEEYKNLPCEISTLYIQDQLEQWFQPIIPSTDFWHEDVAPACDMNPSKPGVPPHSGKGMAGIISALISFQGGTPYRVEYKEYLGVQLNHPLEVGAIYQASYYAKNSSPYSKDRPVMRADNLSILLSDSLIFDLNPETSPDHLTMKPTIESDSVIGRMWTKINGCVVPAKQMEYLYIGNFGGIDSTTLSGSIVDDQGFALAYYFIDDVSVEKLPYDLHVLTEQSICINNGAVKLDASVGGAVSYKWQDGLTTPKRSLSVQVNSAFYVDITFQECTYRHTFKFDEIPQIDLGADTTMCTDEVLKLTNRHRGTEVVWDDGTTDSVRYVKQSGSYSASAQSNGCVISDGITVDFKDCPGYVPNVITPNDDGLNETLVFENLALRSWSLQIINRWGQEVYYTREYNNNWNGDGAVDGIYYFRLYSAELNKEVTGWVHVKRSPETHN